MILCVGYHLFILACDPMSVWNLFLTYIRAFYSVLLTNVSNVMEEA